MSDLKQRFLDKTKKCNRRCSSCNFWISFKDSTIGNPKDYCSNPDSIYYNQLRDYWHICREFTWASNIIDKNEIKGEKEIWKKYKKLMRL